jgi:hypothetical protein
MIASSDQRTTKSQKMIKRIGLTLICSLAVLIVKAQNQSPELISTAGDFFMSSNFNMSWSLGELETETFKTSTVILTQGFQQPAFNITSIKSNSLQTNLNIEVYPNPVRNFLTIKNYDPSAYLTYQIYDMYGSLIISRESEINAGMFTQIDLSDLSKGNYLIQIINKDKKQRKIYKLIKI